MMVAANTSFRSRDLLVAEEIGWGAAAQRRRLMMMYRPIIGAQSACVHGSGMAQAEQDESSGVA